MIDVNDQVPEQWRVIPGWRGFYEVSDHGQVRSVDRTIPYSNGQERRHRGQILNPQTDRGGYKTVHLRRPGHDVRHCVHRLVLLAFVGPCPPGMETRHLNGNAGDSRLSNLTWGTPSENMLDQVRHRTHHYAFTLTCPRGHGLRGANIGTSHKREGRRTCRACDAARSWGRHRGLTLDDATVLAYADRKYAEYITDLAQYERWNKLVAA